MVTRKEIKWQIVDNIEVIVETNGKRFDLRINIYPQTVKRKKKTQRNHTSGFEKSKI